MRREKKDRDWSGGVTCEVRWEVGGVKKRAVYRSIRQALQKRSGLNMEYGLEAEVVRMDTGSVVVNGKGEDGMDSERFWNGFFRGMSRNAV